MAPKKMKSKPSSTKDKTATRTKTAASPKKSAKTTASPRKSAKGKAPLQATVAEAVATDEGVFEVVETVPPAAEPIATVVLEADGKAAGDGSAKKVSRHTYATAETMAKSQRNISVSEFFAKNRHLLGFDNPRKALLTTVKEAVDNSLDACEEAGIAPCIELWIEQISETIFRASIQDNGPGIVKSEIPNIFGRLLYGSKFHAMKMARGQQGIGISAAGMYGLLTTGKNVQVTSRVSPKKPAHYYELRIDTRNNRPEVVREEQVEWDVQHGTKVSIELEAKYQKGRASVDEYLQQSAIANPHATFIYHAPDGRSERYDASVQTLPEPTKSVKPHPYGVELGVLIRMLHETRSRRVCDFLTNEFSRVSPRTAKEILAAAGLAEHTSPGRCVRGDAQKLHQAIQATKIMAPSSDSVAPIGEEQLLEGLRKVIPAEFTMAVTRRPAVYRGNPFIIEAALAYGATAKDQAGSDEDDDGDARKAEAEPQDMPLVKVVRFANRVPLLYLQSACAIYKSIVQMNWRAYGLPQGRGALPSGPATIVVHVASVWVPFTSESKEAVADYPEITKEIKLALQECGRRLGQYVRRQARTRDELKKRSYIEKYIPHIGIALRDILDLSDKQVHSVNTNLKDILERSRKL